MCIRDRPRFAHWRWVRLSVLALAAAATWALVGRPREEVPVNLTYELDLAGAADGRLVITMICDGDLPRQLDLVEEVTIETAREVVRRVQPGLKGFDPFIRYHTFAESSIGFSVILRAQEFTERYVLMHEFVKALHRRYKSEGIVIPYPMRTLQIDMNPSFVHEH